MGDDGTGKVKTLWMGDMGTDWDEAKVKELLAETGKKVEVQMVRDKTSGKSAGYCFLTFLSHEDADFVLKQFAGKPMLYTGGTHFYKLRWGKGYGKSGSSIVAKQSGDTIESEGQFGVFVGDLASDVSENDLEALFLSNGYTVLSVKIITDGQGQSKGFGFLYFPKSQDRDRAIQEMNGTLLKNKPIKVTHAAYTRFLNNSTLSTPKSTEEGENTCVFVGGLDESVTPEILRHHFGLVGEIGYVRIPPGRGCGFVGYIHRKHAVAAIATLQGLRINGYKVRLAWGSMKPGTSKAAAAQQQAYLTTSIAATNSSAMQPLQTQMKKEYKTPFGTLTQDFSSSTLPEPKTPWKPKNRTASSPLPFVEEPLAFDETPPFVLDDDIYIFPSLSPAYNSSYAHLTTEATVPCRLAKIQSKLIVSTNHQLSSYVAQLRARYTSYNHAIASTLKVKQPPAKRQRLDLFSLHTRRTVIPGRVTPDEAYSDDLLLAKWIERHVHSAINGMDDVLPPPPPLVKPNDAISFTPMANYLRSLSRISPSTSLSSALANNGDTATLDAGEQSPRPHSSTANGQRPGGRLSPDCSSSRRTPPPLVLAAMRPGPPPPIVCQSLH